MPRLIKIGKVKKIYEINNELEFYFTDNISVFDKIIPTKVPDKGASLCRTATYWFMQVSKLNIKNHFIKIIENNRMRVQRFDVLPSVNTGTKNYLIPLEFITRYFVAGSLFDRLQAGKIKKEEVGVKNIKYGTKLDSPFFEITTKFETYDRVLSLEEAQKIGGLTKSEIEEIKELTFKIDKMLNNAVLSRGLLHVDGKKEWALDQDRTPVLVDTFGTADEDRFWDLSRYNTGEYIELSKEFVRKYYRKIGYYNNLQYARANNLEEPEIPAMPQELVEQTSALYKKMYELLTGNSW